MGYLGATQVFTQAHRADVSLRDVTIARHEKRGYQERMTSRTRSAWRILGILKKVSRVENWKPNEKGWLPLARGGLGQVSHEMGGQMKKPEKNVYLSPYVEEPLNSNVIKSFVPELRSRKCFSCFEIPTFYVYIYIWTLYVYITRSHIRIWLWYINPCRSKTGQWYL